MKKLLASVVALVFPVAVMAAGGSYNEHVVEAKINPKDTVSLQRGAQIYVNNCLGCHSLKYMRYSRMAQDLNIPKELVEQYMMFNTNKVGEHMLTSMDAEDAKSWFGNPPPDLTLHARLKSADWLYSYLINFYKDIDRPYGYNNRVFPDVGMPYVLADMEAELGEEKFQEAMLDLTNFMAYTAEPVRLEREAIGKKVIAFLVILLIAAYFLKREYWKDVYAKG